MKRPPHLLVLLAAALPAAICYAPALPGGFISDDTVLVAANPSIRSFPDALGSFRHSYWHGLKQVAPYYRPLVIVSFAVDYSVGGPRPFFYHVTNLLLHAACAALAGWLVLGLARIRSSGGGGERGVAVAATAGACLAAALAATHPIHSEPSAAIYGRPDLLAAALGLAFLNLAVRGRFAGALLCLAAALFAKESVIVLPLLAPFAFALGGRVGARRPALVGAISGGALLALYLAIRRAVLGGLSDPAALSRLDNPLLVSGTSESWLTPFSVIARYAGLWLWPAGLCGDRGFDTVPLAAGPGDAHFLAGAALLVAALALLVLLAARRSPWALLLAAALVTYAPASNLLLLAPALMAERFVYLPSILLCALAGAAYARLAGETGEGALALPGWPFGRGGLHAVAALLILVAGARTFVRAGDFRDEIGFYGSAVSACPRSAKAQYNLGNALAREGRHPEALVAYGAAVRIAPWLGIAHTNLGNSFLALHRLEEAERAYRDAIGVSPDLMNPHASLAGVLYMSGRLEEALGEVRIAIALSSRAEDEAQLREMERRIADRLDRLDPPAP